MHDERGERRAAGLAARRGLTVEQRARASEIICRRLSQLPEFGSSRRIAMFLSMPEEVNLRSLLPLAWGQGSEVYLPHVVRRGQPLEFYQYGPDSVLRTRRFGIEELDPQMSDRGDPRQFDLILVPLVAFDRFCHRIGMGAGYYDRTLAFRQDPQTTLPFMIGVAFQIQQQPPWTASPWDVSLDRVVTEAQELVIRR